MILPERVFGRSSAQMIRFGRANLPIRSATTLADPLDQLVAGLGVAPERDEGADRLAGVLVGLADHRRLGDLSWWATIADSTSAVESRWPETLTTSSMRPITQK